MLIDLIIQEMNANRTTKQVFEEDFGDIEALKDSILEKDSAFWETYCLPCSNKEFMNELEKERHYES